MSNSASFQTQFLSVMEILGKAAVAEINRCVGDSCAVFRLEISQSQREIETLKHKLEMLERELMKTRRKKSVCSPAMMKNCPVGDRVTGQEWSFRRRGGGKSTAVEEIESPLQSSTNQFEPDELQIKKETQDLDLICHDQQPTPAREEQKRQTTPVEMEQITQSEPSESEQGKDPRVSRHPEELREQHRCGHSDEELSGFEFVVKAEQEEEHVAQRLSQTGCELSAGRLNTLGSECVMYERDNQLWTSCILDNSEMESNDPVYSNATEQCSLSLSIYSAPPHAPTSMEVSGSTQSSFGVSCAALDKVGGKPSVCSEELRSEAVHTQQGHRERLVHKVERENQTLLPQQRQHGPSVKHRRGSERPAQPQSGSLYETSSSLSTGAFNARKKGKVDRQADLQNKPFVCIYCGKTFDRCSHLITHHRVHTGEKPFSCAQCGRCFSRKNNLVRHERLHSRNKPFGCAQCGKRFARGTDLRAHHRIAHHSALVHERSHAGETIQL